MAGGPVYIPKLYDGRNKTFWLANYEGWRITTGGTIRDSVPNPPVLTGRLFGRASSGIWNAGLRDESEEQQKLLAH